MEIAYTRTAIKDLSRIPADRARLIRAKISQYAAAPASLANMVSRLQGRSGYRLRVGDYRVIFDQNGRVLTVLHIGHRGNVYED
jgi:mRNA interferase RelE/StbE